MRRIHIVVLEWIVATAALFLIAMSGACSGKTPAIDAKKFDDVHHAGQAMKSATAVGITIVHYRELLATFDTEVSMVRDKANNDLERKVAAMYDDSLAAYKDELTVWNMEFVHDDSFIVVPDKRHPEVMAIIAQYHIPTVRRSDGTMPSLKHDKLTGIEVEPSLSIVWAAASAKLDAANKASQGS